MKSERVRIPFVICVPAVHDVFSTSRVAWDCSSKWAGLLEGTFNVIVFNETTFTLNQQIEETMGDLTVKANVNLSLERK